MMRALVFRSKGMPGAGPNTFSRRGLRHEATSKNDTVILRQVAQTRPEEVKTGMSLPVARILLPTGLILGKLGIVRLEFPRLQVGC